MAGSPEYYSSLYLGKNMDDKRLGRIKKQLLHHPAKADVCLITLSRNGFDQLDLYESSLLEKSYYRKNPPFIIGIADDRDEAVGLVCQIALECYLKTGNCMLKEYLLC